MSQAVLAPTEGFQVARPSCTRSVGKLRKPSVRDIVRRRAGNICERCGKKPARNPGGKYRGTQHHRVPQRRYRLDSPENMVLLCFPCHREIHADEEAAARFGWFVYGDHPELTPFLHAERGWVLLLENGATEKIEDWEARSLVDWAQKSA